MHNQSSRICTHELGEHLALPYALRMTSTLAANIKALRMSLGLSQQAFADRLRVQQSYISKWENGTVVPQGDSIAALATMAGCSFEDFKATPLGQGASKPSDQPKLRSVDSGETAPVTRLDLSYSMGPGADLDSSYVDGEAFEFDIGFLRSMTVTPPDRIRIVDGIGDSMQPTLHDRDLLFIDINQRDLNAQDRIWAIWLFGLGAVKRLRAVGPDRVLVISDNPDVANQEVSRTDILIHGRVIGSIKRH